MSTIARTRSRTLYIIAPTLYDCVRTARAFNLIAPGITNFRNITSAYQMRGVSPGTPFITLDRKDWAATREGHELDAALTAYQRSGHLRIAQEDDLREHRLYDDLPSRPVASKEARAGL